MSPKMNRRELIRAGAAAGLAAALPKGAFGEAPAVIAPKSAKPLVISAFNGNVFKNCGDVTCVQKAFTMITQGSDVLDALIAGVNLVELDPGAIVPEHSHPHEQIGIGLRGLITHVRVLHRLRRLRSKGHDRLC